jgi:hypothetical protein
MQGPLAAEVESINTDSVKNVITSKRFQMAKEKAANTEREPRTVYRIALSNFICSVTYRMEPLSVYLQNSIPSEL